MDLCPRAREATAPPGVATVWVAVLTRGTPVYMQAPAPQSPLQRMARMLAADKPPVDLCALRFETNLPMTALLRGQRSRGINLIDFHC